MGTCKRLKNVCMIDIVPGILRGKDDVISLGIRRMILECMFSDCVNVDSYGL